MSKIAPCLWFAGEAEEAAKFYVTLLPDSRVDRVQRSPVDTPGCKAGDALVVAFTLAGQSFIGLNGGPGVPYTNAVSFTINCDDQAEVDDLVAKAAKSGGKADPNPQQDYGFMYGRSFEDPDGNVWETFWMDPAAVNAPPEAVPA